VDHGATTPDWIIAAGTVLAAVGTVLAFVVAFAQIRQERRARQRLEAETRLRERREQAEHVSGWLSTELGWLSGDLDRTQPIALHNASVEPVYRAIVWMVFIQGAGPHTGKEAAEFPYTDEIPGWVFRSMLSLIPPGTSYTTVPGGFAALSARPGIELAFTDHAGVHWLRSSDGGLTEIPEPPTDYYGLDGPQDWRVPEPTPKAAPLEPLPRGLRDRTRIWNYRLRRLVQRRG
jgi:hypothetical protein